MITVNGVNLRDFGFVASGRPQLPRLGGERTHVQQIPGRLGGVRMGGIVEGDTITVQGYVDAPDHATLLERLDLLAGVLQGRSVIRLSDYPDREWIGHLQQGPSRASAIGPAWITRAENVVLQWSLPDPTAHGSGEIVQVPGALALGTAPSPLRIEVQNGGVAPITRVVVEAFPQELLNGDFESDPPGAWWTAADDGISYPSFAGNARSGERYARLEQVAGQTRATFQVERDTGAVRRTPVRPGDVCDYGGWARMAGGDGYARTRLTSYDADRATITTVNAPSVRATAWTLSAGSYIVPPGAAYVGVRCELGADGSATSVARFDDAHLHIRRRGEPQRILQWDGAIAPGAAWECDAELFRVLNGGANAIDGLTADSEFPVAEPGRESGYGYVQVTITGGGGHTSTVRYRRRWL